MRGCPELGATAAAALAVVAALAAAPYPESPPPAHTGGFGEPSCHACHFDREVGESGGELLLEGLPERWKAGEQYHLTVRLSHPELRRAGFQLSARFEDGTQAGALDPVDEATTITRAAGILYSHQTLAGSKPAADAAAEWRLAWTAPACMTGSVLFHLSANAANGDASEFGDRVYVLETVAAP